MKRLSLKITALCTMAIIVACGGDDMPVNSPEAVGGTQEQMPVAFTIGERQGDENANTRAGFQGEMTTQMLRSTGFGVFAKVNGGSGFDFMTNQYVYYSGSWGYRPLKYWPNYDSKISFFAYAPHITSSEVPYSNETTALANAVTDGKYGILSLPTNSSTEAKIAYRVAASPMESVDLMYGVAAHAYNSTTNAPGVEASSVTAGMPFINMTKQLTGSALTFWFGHALTGLVAYVAVEAENTIDWVRTRVVIEDLTLSSNGQKLYTLGVLNLNNTAAYKPRWEDLSGPVTSLADFIDPRMRYVSGGTFGSQPAMGVSLAPKSLFGQGIDGTSDARMMFIPGPADGLVTFTVKYHVVKADGTDTELVSSATPEITFIPGQTVVLSMHLLVPT